MYKKIYYYVFGEDFIEFVFFFAFELNYNCIYELVGIYIFFYINK